VPIEIIGGASSVGAISIHSTEYVSIASLHDGIVHCEVIPFGEEHRFLMKQRFVPRLVRLLLIFLSDMTNPQRYMVIFLIGAGILLLTLRPLFGAEDRPVSPWFILTLFCLSGLYNLKGVRAVAPWHGAEHMAIESYWQTGTTDLEAIKKCSPVHKHCGGRLFVPFLLILITGFCFIRPLSLKTLGFVLLAAEIILWTDHLIGLHKIPITSHASYAIQRYLTTSEPGPIELSVAHTALIELVAAHERKERQ
jgi:hypothetical protein